jgi:hypothetical protein
VTFYRNIAHKSLFQSGEESISASISISNLLAPGATALPDMTDSADIQNIKKLITDTSGELDRIIFLTE